MIIKYVSSEADRICAQIKNAKSKGSGASGNVSRARGLEAAVSSRMNISDDLSYLSKSVSRDLSRLDLLANALQRVESDFEEADQSVRSKSKKLSAHIRKARTEALWESVNGAWLERVSLFLKKHGVLMGILGAAAVATNSAVLIGGTSVALLSAWAASQANPPHEENGSNANAQQHPQSQNNGSQGAASAGESDQAASTDQEMQERISQLLKSDAFLGSEWPAGETREITKQMYTDFISRASKIMGISVFGNYGYDSPSGYAGWFSPTHPSTIFVNNQLVGVASDYDSYEMNLRIIVHEMRHAYQYTATQNPGKYPVDQATLDQWSYEMDHYVDVTDSFQGYTEQACEKDARSFTAEAFKDY